MPTTTAPESIFEKLRKIKALADSGATRGEQFAARLALEAMLSKHGLTINDIHSQEVTEHLFKVKQADYKVWLHCVAKAMGYPEDMCVMAPRWGEGVKTHKYVMMTNQQYVDSITLFDFYIAAWREEMESFSHAFLCKHNLARPPKSDEPPPEPPDNMESVMAMMRGLKDRPNPLTTAWIGHESETTHAD